MHYLEDYLETLESLPADLQQNFTRMRETDLKVQNTADRLDKKIKANFVGGKKGAAANKEVLYKQILGEYQKALELADDKVKLANETSGLLMRHKQRLDAEIKKFAAELELATPGITVQAEQRSMKLDDRQPSVQPAPVKRAAEPEKDATDHLQPRTAQSRKQRSRTSSRGHVGSGGADYVEPSTLVLSLAPADTLDTHEPRYCICNQVSYGDMVGCDNEDCVREWFHYACVGITEPPNGKWYCPDCTAALKRRGQLK